MIAKFWQRLWDRAPRQLRFTRAGRVLVGIALAAGLAAMNTGNNLLFFGWGMVLSAIVVSGVLSEASLRILEGAATMPGQARAFEAAHLPITITNTSRRMPAYALEVVAEVRGVGGFAAAPAPYQLRLPPGADAAMFAQFVPTARGRLRVAQLVAKTAYPFGFFEKSRRLRLSSELQFWCFPHAVNVEGLANTVKARLGEVALPHAGSGEDFFSLRPYRQGDDVRRVAWRRSARTGRWVVVENEAVSGREVVLELQPRLQAGAAQVEHGIAVLGSLAEALLVRGYRVGVRAPGTWVQPATGERQRWDILTALAKLEPTSPLPALPWSRDRLARVALVGEGAAAPSTAEGVMLLPIEPMGPQRSAA